MTKNSGSMREKMPETARFIDEMRDVFGAEPINRVIRGQLIEGKEIGFWASENGHTVGKCDTSLAAVTPSEFRR